jgi:hypothetical protein
VRTSVTLINIGRSTVGWATVAALVLGCRTPPPPPRIQVPTDTRGHAYSTYQHDPVKPLPPSATQSALENPQVVAVEPPPTMPPPVSQAYLDAYDRVGRPRILVLVERAQNPTRAIVPGDYDTLERVVRGSLAAEGQVATVSPNAARTLNEQQVRDIVAGKQNAMADAGSILHADVLVLVRVAPSANEREETQITATARNTRDGQPIATAASSLPAPPQRRQIDYTGRLLGERLVDELTGAWENLARTAPPGAATQPATAPAGLTG